MFWPNNTSNSELQIPCQVLLCLTARQLSSSQGVRSADEGKGSSLHGNVRPRLRVTTRLGGHGRLIIVERQFYVSPVINIDIKAQVPQSAKRLLQKSRMYSSSHRFRLACLACVLPVTRRPLPTVLIARRMTLAFRMIGAVQREYLLLLWRAGKISARLPGSPMRGATLRHVLATP